jgi:hypothetical protein
MQAGKTRSIRSALKSQRKVLLRELATLRQQIIEVEQGKTQLGEKIKMLEQGQRQAA